MTHIFRIVMMLAIAALFAGFSGKPDQFSLRQLQAAPDTLVLDQQRLILQCYLWRDFMPNSPPSGKPLRAALTILPADSGSISRPTAVVKMWVLNGDSIWSALPEPAGRLPVSFPLSRLEYRAGGGPRWGPGFPVTVVIRVRDSAGRHYLLRAGNQFIQRTD